MSLAALIGASIVLAFWVGLPVLLVGWLILITRREERQRHRELERAVWRELDRAREIAWLDTTFEMPCAPDPRWRVGS